MDELRERVRRLEENSYFQERSLEELNAIITHQQEEIVELHGKIRELLKRCDVLSLLLEGAMENPLPPHSVPHL